MRSKLSLVVLKLQAHLYYQYQRIQRKIFALNAYRVEKSESNS